jgi:ribosomal protein S27AE
MHEDVLKKLAQRVDRRSFLRGSGLAAAALIGAAALPSAAFAQDKQDDKGGQGKKDEEKDPFKETKIDEQGKPYRVCPQCGFNMYQQEKIWTCENCGYSYTE